MLALAYTSDDKHNDSWLCWDEDTKSTEIFVKSKKENGGKNTVFVQ